jgi:hypothetical protein
MAAPIDRRRFLYQTAAGLGVLSASLAAGCAGPKHPPEPPLPRDAREPNPLGGQVPAERIDYPEDRPNIVLVRFGGGVRRRETVEYPAKTYCPFILHELAEKRGVLYNNVVIENKLGVDTSHGQGTLYILTGQYRHYQDIQNQPLADRFVPQGATIPEYLRKWYRLAEHETLIVNGEDRVNEEFFTFSDDRLGGGEHVFGNHLFGVNFKSRVLSLYGFKTYLLQKQLEPEAAANLSPQERKEKEHKVAEMVKRDYLADEVKKAPPTEELRKEREESDRKIADFWADWRAYYGDSGLVNPRGDRLLTALTLRAMKQLRPRFVMINYQDPDYVHWGNPQFYTRAISIIDDGVREVYEAVQADEFYRDRTVFVVVPDCGRDNNPGMAVPFQHHFNTRCAHEVFAVMAGPEKFVGDLRSKSGKPQDRTLQQTSIAATVGELTGFKAVEAEAPPLWDKA